MRIPAAIRTLERPDGSTPRRGEHACLVYAEARGAHEIAARFLASGLACGERGLYVSAGRDVSSIVDALDKEGVDAADQVACGALRLTTASRTYLRGGVFSPAAVIELLRLAIAESRTDGYVGLRATGEMGWAASDPGLDRLEGYESDLAATFAAGGLTGLCQYERRAFAPELLERLVRLHPVRLATSPSTERSGIGSSVAAFAQYAPGTD